MKRPDRIKTAPDQGMGDRVPPGQFVTNKFPVLTYGPEPEIKIESWTLRVFGMVERELSLDWQQFAALPWRTVDADFHCVTQWSALDQTWEGVALSDLIAPDNLSPKAKFLMAHCYGGYSANLPLELALAEGLLAHKAGRPAHRQKPRLAPAPGHPQPLRLEKRQVGQRHRTDGRRLPRLLGTARLPQQRRPLERGTLLARIDPLTPQPATPECNGFPGLSGSALVRVLFCLLCLFEYVLGTGLTDAGFGPFRFLFHYHHPFLVSFVERGGRWAAPFALRA